MDVLNNKALLAAACGWFVAQLIKIIISLVQEKKFDFALIMSSGGMPSSHSATVYALAITIMRLCSPASPEFALAVIFAFIVMYDATGVRREAGEHAKMLNLLVDNIFAGKKEYTENDFKELIGHTPYQVFMGAALGILIGIVFPI